MTTPLARAVRERDGAHLRILLSDPPGNLLSLEMIASIRRAIDELQPDGPLKLLTLESSGSDFSFGAKIQEHLPPFIRQVLPEAHGLIRDLLAVPAVTGAVVRGRCLGGAFEMVLACDFIFASADATMGFPEIALGGFAPAASALLPARIGSARAARPLVTGDALPVADWRTMGLLELVSSHDRLEEEVSHWFDRHLHTRSAAALRHAAQAARLVLAGQVLPALDAAERLYLTRLIKTQDAVEGVMAFLEKRSPKWNDC